MATRKRASKPKVEPKKKKMRLQDPKGEKIVALLRWLESKGGSAQEPILSIAEQTGIDRLAIMRAMRWLEVYGAVHVNRNTGAVFGEGRRPNAYEQLMSVEVYLRDADAIRDAIRAKLKAPRPVYPRRRSVIDPAELKLIEQQAKAEVAASLASAGPLPPLASDPLGYEDVEAWNLAFNAD